MPAPFPNVKSIFLAALEKTNPTEHALFLEEACGTNATLSKEVHDLLAAHAAAQGYLAAAEATGAFTPAAEGQTAMPQASGKDPLLGTMVDRYKLLQRLGEGGMGIVYLAEQTEPVHRKVALKIIRAGMDSDQVLARFEAERQALAMMDHPNIARVLDGGTTTNHRPYFVMELVKGIPLTKYCDDQHLTPQQRLELFIPICQAVQHAHQKGIIHRDLKPSNILIALYDGKPVPKVIDFGVAKALHHRLTESTMFTEVGSVIGTLEYMSPEQVELNNLDIDTRSDIYSLGVILYELLTGERPLDSKRLRNAAFTEMLRIIREEEPSKPSTKLSQSEKLASISAQRKMEPVRLSRLMQGDLDWIVMKALAKERDRRYETANGFAMDIQRYLSDEPVSAGPPSAGYRLRKFVKRNKGQVIAASLVLLTLVAGVVGTSVGLYQANLARDAEARQREIAEANERTANTEKANAERARQEEERQRKFAEAVARFVQEDFLALTSVEGQESFGGAGKGVLNKDTTLRELLDRAAEKLRARKDLDPRIEAELCWIVGVNYRGTGEAAKGVPFLERAVELLQLVLGADHSNTLSTRSSLCVAYVDAGQLDKALPLFEETLTLSKAKLGPDHPVTLNSMNNLASGYEKARKLDRAMPLFEETLKLRKAKLGPDHPNTLTSMNNLAFGYHKAGKLDLALPFYEETLKLYKAKLGPDHLDTLTCMGNLASVYWDAGQRDKALPLFEETLKLFKAKLGPDHPRTLLSMHNLAVGYRDAGQWNKALPLLEETLKLWKAKLGPDHPNTLANMNNLAMSYWSLKQLDKSVPMFEELLPLLEKKLGRTDLQTQKTVANLGVNYSDAGRVKEAIPLLEEAYRASKKFPELLRFGEPLFDAYAKDGQYDKAVSVLEETLKLMKAEHGPDHPDTFRLMNNLARGYRLLKKLDKSVPLFE